MTKTENVDFALIGICGLMGELDKNDTGLMDVYADILDHTLYMRRSAKDEDKAKNGEACANPWTDEVPTNGEVSE